MFPQVYATTRLTDSFWRKQHPVQNPLAVEILKRPFAEADRVTVDYVGDEFTFLREAQSDEQ